MEPRIPVVSGVFYQSDPENLRESLRSMFMDTKPLGNLGVISPHAGYPYSGRTSAFSIASLKPSKRFIIMGPNHNLLGEDMAVMSSGKWRTPLGEAVVDTGIAKELLENEVVKDDPLAHSREHSIEVQLPFLQQKFGSFSFVPLSISGTDYSGDFLSKCMSVGKTLSSIAREHDARIIASSDFSHYISQEEANEKDGKAVEMIKKLDLKGLFRTLESIDASVCGYGPIAILMATAKELGWKKIDVINRSSSGDVVGDRSSVVTYYSIGFR